jgi:hypothetical protein
MFPDSFAPSTIAESVDGWGGRAAVPAGAAEVEAVETDPAQAAWDLGRDQDWVLVSENGRDRAVTSANPWSVALSNAA